MTLGDQVVAVNGHRFAAAELEDAIRSAEKGDPITLVVVREDLYRTVTLTYTGGLRYPHLERIEGQPDLLTDIIAPPRRRGHRSVSPGLFYSLQLAYASRSVGCRSRHSHSTGSEKPGRTRLR